MNVFVVSFRFKESLDRDDRYESLMEEIRKCNAYWLETTSFAVVQTTETLDDFERRLFLSDFSPSKDKLLVVQVGNNDAIARGDIEYPNTLRSMLPNTVIK